MSKTIALITRRDSNSADVDSLQFLRGENPEVWVSDGHIPSSEINAGMIVTHLLSPFAPFEVARKVEGAEHSFESVGGSFAAFPHGAFAVRRIAS